MDRELHGIHRRRRLAACQPSFRLLTVALAMSATPFAHACSPIKVAYVYFEKNSASVSAARVSKLAHWMADLRVMYRNHGSITLHAMTEPGEHSPDSLGMERAHNVARVLKDNLGLEEAKVQLPERSHVIAPSSSKNLRGEKQQSVLGVDVEFLPACPHECPCQRDDPLYKPPSPR